MDGWKKIAILLGSLLIISMMAQPAFSNIPKVVVSAPPTVKTGDTLAVKLAVNHMGNSPSHYVDSVRLYDGNRLLKEWKFTSADYLKDTASELTYSYTPDMGKDVDLKAVAHCNIHGDGTGMMMVRATW
jgi:desulfoferrodoxin (superoxide reductase-like protein)